MKVYDYINRIDKTLLILVYEGTWTYSPLSLLCITMILCVRRNFFEITTFPNIGPLRLGLETLGGGAPHLPWGALHPPWPPPPLGRLISQGRRPPWGPI